MTIKPLNSVSEIPLWCYGKEVDFAAQFFYKQLVGINPATNSIVAEAITGTAYTYTLDELAARKAFCKSGSKRFNFYHEEE